MLRKVIVGLALAGGLALGTGIAVVSAEAQIYGHGSLSVTKVVSPDPLGIGNSTQFPMTVTCTSPSGSYSLNLPGNTSSVPTTLPIGSICSVAETLPKPPPGCTWLAPVYSPATVTIARGMNVLTVTNGYQCKDTGSQECLKDLKAEVKCNPNGTYTLTLSGSGFTGTTITLTSQTPGVTVTPPQQPWAATTTWTITGATPGQIVTLTANATQAGGGSVPGTDLCCSGEIKIKMPDCPKPIDVKIGKEDTATGGSGTWFNLWVTNVGAPITFPAGGITVTDVIPAGMTVTGLAGTGPNWTCLPPIPPPLVGLGTLTCKYNLAGTLAFGADLLESILVHYTTTGPGPFKNCATVSISPAVGVDTNPANDTACVTVTGTPIDVSITKTGFTSPPDCVNHFTFTLTMKNQQSAFSGANAITVTDTVPIGFDFVSYTSAGSNWTCIPMPTPGGTPVNCTYTGPGPAVGPNAPLGWIKFVATATYPPPYQPVTNCAATIGFTPSSGLQDSNPADNTSNCVTLTKSIICPQVPNPLSCNPTTSQMRGGECVCRYPNMMRNSEGACVCPDGQNFVAGRGCVPQIDCRKPMIPNAAGTDCICPKGTVQKGRECVRRIECNRPAVPNPAGTACICPLGMTAVGKSCVQLERQLPPIKLPGGRPRETPRGQGGGTPGAVR